MEGWREGGREWEKRETKGVVGGRGLDANLHESERIFFRLVLIRVDSCFRTNGRRGGKGREDDCP